MYTLAKSFRSFCEGLDSTTFQCLCQESVNAQGSELVDLTSAGVSSRVRRD